VSRIDMIIPRITTRQMRQTSLGIASLLAELIRYLTISREHCS